ncbi:MAG: hypothetical protein ACREQA_19775 [Candidatus Binatia bacterium]
MARVTFRGPIFDGRSEIAAKRMERAIEDEVSDEGLSLVKTILRANIRGIGPHLYYPGYYMSRQQKTRVVTKTVIHDSKVLYGRWLEGVNENNRTSSFKGYHAYKKATFQLELRSKGIANRTAIRFVRRMQ